MLIKRDHLERIVRGEVRLAFRRWKRPTVKTGGVLHSAMGLLGIDEVRAVPESALSGKAAREAGFGSLSELRASLQAGNERQLYRIRLRYLGQDPRLALRTSTGFTATELKELRERLARFDERSTRGAWTARILALIEARPGTLAATLAAELEQETAWFKPQVRKLKALGLTESLEVGYRLSARGEAFLVAERAELRKKA